MLDVRVEGNNQNTAESMKQMLERFSEAMEWTDSIKTRWRDNIILQRQSSQKARHISTGPWLLIRQVQL